MCLLKKSSLNTCVSNFQAGYVKKNDVTGKVEGFKGSFTDAQWGHAIRKVLPSENLYFAGRLFDSLK